MRSQTNEARTSTRARCHMLAGALAVLVAGPAAGQDAQRVVIQIEGSLPARCISEPVRVLVTNQSVRVTQYLRCNHPGRFVIRLDERARGHWKGTGATRAGKRVPLDGGSAEFPIHPGPGAEETIILTARNPASLRALADALSTAVLVQ